MDPSKDSKDLILSIKRNLFEINEISPNLFSIKRTITLRTGQQRDETTYFNYNKNVIIWTHDPNKISVYEIESKMNTVYSDIDKFEIRTDELGEYIVYKDHNKRYTINHIFHETNIFSIPSLEKHSDNIHFHTPNITTVDHLLNILS